MKLYSNLNNDIDEMSNKEISNLYENEFKNGKCITLSQLISEYLDLINQNRIAFDNKSLNNIRKCVYKIIPQKKKSIMYKLWI